MEKPIITISEGKIQGITLKSILGQSYLAFKSIPFAQPPIGPLRFRDPQQPLKWSGIRDASKHSGDCPLQYQTDGPKPYDIIGDEDCLYLNIYTNKIGHKRPVMFYIYGGGFVEGTGNDSIYREDYFMIKDVVLVYVNYRLGPMGFLNVGQEIASGNQGLKDILFALKWVQNNIEAFGGDPDNVTIFGHSAGSMICHLFTLLPATKGLFHKAILQSGLAILAKNLVTGKDCKNGFKVASLLGMDSNDPIKVVEFLRTVPAKKLISLQGHLTSKWEREVMDIMEYSPIVDVYYTKDPLIPSCINQLLKNDTNVPIIIGHTCDEALLSFMGRFDDLDNYKFYNDTIEDILKNKLISMEQSKFDEIMKYVQEYYLKNEPINTRNAWNLIRLLTDIFNACERKIVDLRNRNANAPTYVYNFSYMGNEPTIYQYDQGPQPYKGVSHGDELSYIFYLSYMKHGENINVPEEGTTDRLVIERFIRMWYNFALTGNPTPEIGDHCITTIWIPSERNNLYYLDINDNLTLKDDQDTEARLFYEKLKKYLF